MGKVTIVLKNPGKVSPILVLFTCYNGRLKYYSGESASNLKNLSRGAKVILSRIERHIDEMAVDYKIKGEPLTREILRASLDHVLKKKVKQSAASMFEQMTRLVDQMEAGAILTPQSKRYSALSIKTYRFTIALLQRFNPKLTLQSTTIATYNKFIQWMQEKGYSTNYIGSQIKNWKVLGKNLGGAVFSDASFKKMDEESFNVYLDEDELKRMADLTLTGRYAIVRDWFILDCYTGLRVSDLTLLSKRNYHNGFITIANEKTDQSVVIPVHPLVKKILDRNKGFPPAVEPVELNKLIKQVAEKAKINDRVLHTITKGGMRKDEYLKKWELITAHSARRSFITNLRKNGVPDTIVMKLSGIRSPQTLKKYDKLSTDEAAKIAAKHKFFK